MPTKTISTTPYWATSATFPQFSPLAEDLATDVVGPAESPLSKVE